MAAARPRRRRRALAQGLATAARAHAADLGASVFVFTAASVMAGRVWRFPFDDEIYTLTIIGRLSPLQLVTLYPARFDVHPPLSYLLFSGLWHLGAGEAGMRLASLSLTALAVALFHLLTVMLLDARRRGDMQPTSRVIAIILFGLCPLAVSQGDALRWYPLFAALFAIFIVLYLAAANDALRLWAAAALGLAGATNLLAAPVALAFALYRYALEKRFVWRFDAAFWLIALASGGLGLYSAGGLIVVRSGEIATQLGNGIARAALTDALGFFGGAALGVGQSWIVMPVLVVCALALAASLERTRVDAPLHLLLLMLAAAALTILPGFAKPRSFLYLAPVVTLFVVLYLDELLRRGEITAALAGLALMTAASVAAIANVAHNTHPFKRNAVIPYQAILDFIDANATGRVLVAATDPVLPWLVNQRGRGSCGGELPAVRPCLNGDRSYDTVVVARGYNDKSGNAALMGRVDAQVAGLTAGRRKLASFAAGRDEDAALKSRLTGVALDPVILTVDIYR